MVGGACGLLDPWSLVADQVLLRRPRPPASAQAPLPASSLGSLLCVGTHFFMSVVSVNLDGLLTLTSISLGFLTFSF